MDQLTSSHHFEIGCYIFRVTATSCFNLPKFKGSTFHGGLAGGLNLVGNRFLNLFYYPKKTSAQQSSNHFLPKPFMIIPPLEEKTYYQSGDSIEFGIVLFGGAARHFMIVFAAIENLGNLLGIGRDQGRFKIEKVLLLSLEKPAVIFENDTWFSFPKKMTIQDILETHQVGASWVSISLMTQLRLKDSNRLVRHPPDFSLLFKRLMGRINTLTAIYGDGVLVQKPALNLLETLTHRIRLDKRRTNVRWIDWSRPIAHKEKKEIYGGLIGEIAYSGNLTPFIPWLALGQWTGLGGKTSFGLGLYDLKYNI